MFADLTASESELRDRFFNLRRPEDIADLLELNSYAFLEYTIFVLKERQRYSKFSIPKKRGGQRVILEPIPNLKIIQSKLLQVLRSVYEPKPAVHGFVAGRSIVTNAARHVANRYVLNLDLEDFFPAIHFGRVRGMFMAFPYHLNGEVATVLAQICTLRACLPQGAPTSPIISNMICAKLDSQLQRLAKKYRCYYTRYADDITFSTAVSNFPRGVAIVLSDESGRRVEVGEEPREIIRSNGFRINPDKVRLQTRNKRQEVTGLTTNQFVNVKRKRIRQIRAMLHSWEKYGYAAAETEYWSRYCHKIPDKAYKRLPPFQKVIKGKIEFVGMVRGRADRIFIRLNNRAALLERQSGLESNLFHFIADPAGDITS